MAPQRDPLATAQQAAFEQTAVRLMRSPAARAAQNEVAAYWLDKIKPDTAARMRFDAEFEQIAFSVMMESLNQDPLYPHVHAFGRFAHSRDGVQIPGTKVGNPNPDYVYRFIAIDGVSRYVIHGEGVGERPTTTEFSVLTKEQAYLANRSSRHISFEADGTFVITVDPDPAGDRPNHMQTGEGACQILIRDIMSDVATQRPFRLWVERVGTPSRAAFGETEALEMYGGRLKKFVNDLLFIGERMIFNKPENVFAQPMVNKGGIYSVAQAYSAGHYRLDEDEALVVTLTLGGAGYAVVPVNNIWGGIGDFLHHRSILGTGRAAPNPDGTYTFVVSLTDPGVNNWVDPDGMREGTMFFRWAGFDPSYEGAPPHLDTRVVKLRHLNAALPPGVPRIDTAGRCKQMAKHLADYTSWLT